MVKKPTAQEEANWNTPNYRARAQEKRKESDKELAATLPPENVGETSEEEVAGTDKTQVEIPEEKIDAQIEKTSGKGKNRYIHLVDGFPAVFDGEQIVKVKQAINVSQMRKNLNAIKSDQRKSNIWRGENAFSKMNYSHILICLDE